mgnify:CR=1 FL=1
MRNNFDKIISQLKRYSELDNSERVSLQNELLNYASLNRDYFIDNVRLINPSRDSVLFEIYEILSKEPETWIDFIITEFNRVQLAVENAKSKDKESVSNVMISLSFYTRQSFNGIDRLIDTINQGLKSKSKQVVKICLDLHADLYQLDKSKYYNSRLKIESFRNSQINDIAQFAKQLIKDFDNPPQKQKLINWYSVYSFFVFIIGIGFTIWTINLRNNTFVDFKYIATAFVFGFILFGLVHYFLTTKMKVKKSETIAICIGYGFMCSFLLLYVNLNFAQNDFHEETFKISSKGNLAKGRYSSCEQPYVEFIRDSKIKSITFRCIDQEQVDKSDSIKLVLKSGLFNFDIIEKKELIITGANNGS